MSDVVKKNDVLYSKFLILLGNIILIGEICSSSVFGNVNNNNVRLQDFHNNNINPFDLINSSAVQISIAVIYQSQKEKLLK